ncbi:MAG: hypothetical protein Q7R66_03160 [Undibacterium sp.]|uniref:hypothetical protein n=1 Tax=Undibacterium sp. TaxID=1914977 RepID=UPI00271EF0C8|nr:hypothetical protein [Undibacterium sp.]MDO8651172.1 hypothetical protein [Undibacterium sp.]
MEFEQAFKIVMEKWPDEVDISDIKFHSSGGANIPELTKAHDAVEKQCLNLGKEIMAMDWSFFQYFHAQAKLLHKQNYFKIIKQNINIPEIEKLYRQNIS